MAAGVARVHTGGDLELEKFGTGQIWRRNNLEQFLKKVRKNLEHFLEKGGRKIWSNFQQEGAEIFGVILSRVAVLEA